MNINQFSLYEVKIIVFCTYFSLKYKLFKHFEEYLFDPYIFDV